MKERPILFSGPMVRAILDERKKQTRRVVKLALDEVVHSPWNHPESARWGWLTGKAGVAYVDNERNCPYGQPGDRLWVRETWYCDDYRVQADSGGFQKPPFNSPEELAEVMYFRADGEPKFEGDDKPNFWCPSIHMPRWASRITLEVTDMRAQRLLDITVADAVAEGIAQNVQHPKEEFRKLWDSINGKRPGCEWTANPWVWVVSFKRVPQ